MPREHDSNGWGHPSSLGLGWVSHASVAFQILFAWSCQTKAALSMRWGQDLAARIVYYYSNPGVPRAFLLFDSLCLFVSTPLFAFRPLAYTST